MRNNIQKLVDISKYAGERFDLVQAGGGNSSVKFDNDEMVIKASGFSLSEVTESSAYSKVRTSQISIIVDDDMVLNAQSKREREKITSNLLQNATIDKKNRPSIETLLHSFLLKYTLHTHPLVVNMIAVKKDWKNILKDIFINEEVVFVAYKTPGIELALELSKELSIFNKIPKIIFLQNHGLIVTTNDVDEIKIIIDNVLEKIESYLKIDMKKYKLPNEITAYFNRIEHSTKISYLSEDLYLNKQLEENKSVFNSLPFCPDSLVFCGVNCIEIDSLDNDKLMNDYTNQYHELPKVVIYQNYIFFIAENIKKAKEMEEVFKFHIMVLIQNKTESINFLKIEELAYLSNWEAEKFRQKI